MKKTSKDADQPGQPVTAVPPMSSMPVVPDFEKLAAQFEQEWMGLTTPVIAYLDAHRRGRTMEPFHLQEALRSIQLCATLGKEAYIQYLVSQQRQFQQLLVQQGQGINEPKEP